MGRVDSDSNLSIHFEDPEEYEESSADSDSEEYSEVEGMRSIKSNNIEQLRKERAFQMFDR